MMFSNYVNEAMRRATYEILDGNEGFYGEIPGFQGVYSNAPTLEECRNDLREVLEGWLVFKLRDNDPDVPEINGCNLTFPKADVNENLSKYNFAQLPVIDAEMQQQMRDLTDLVYQQVLKTGRTPVLTVNGVPV